MFSVSYQYTAVTQISFCQPRTQCNQREIDLPKNKRKFQKVSLRKDHFKETFHFYRNYLLNSRHVFHRKTSTKEKVNEMSFQTIFKFSNGYIIWQDFPEGNCSSS